MILRIEGLNPLRTEKSRASINKLIAELRNELMDYYRVKVNIMTLEVEDLMSYEKKDSHD